MLQGVDDGNGDAARKITAQPRHDASDGSEMASWILCFTAIGPLPPLLNVFLVCVCVFGSKISRLIS